MADLSVDEAILAALGDLAVHTSSELAAGLDTGERTVRRRLRRLIGGGYVFSPYRGGYRITAAGVAVMAPLATPPGLADAARAGVIARRRDDRR